MRKRMLIMVLGTLTMFLPSGSLDAQDLAIVGITYPENNQRVHLVYNYEVEFKLANVGTTNILGSTVGFDFSFDNQFYQAYTMNSSTGLIKPGDTLDVTLPALTFATGNATLNFCVELKQNSDINPANNKKCHDVRFSLDSYFDLKPVRLRITEPAINDTIVEAGLNIIKMEAWVRNSGNVTIPRDKTIILKYQMYTKTRNYFGNIKTSLDTGEVFIVNLIGGHPDVQASTGVFNVCVTVDNIDDQNKANNEFCQKFYAYNFLSIPEIDGKNIESFVNQDQLNLKAGQEAVVDVFVYNELGQQKYQQRKMLNEGLQFIDINSWSPGVYILKIFDTKGNPLHSNKIYID